MKVRFELVVDLGNGAVDDDEWREEMIQEANKAEDVLSQIGELQEFGNGLKWEPVG